MPKQDLILEVDRLKNLADTLGWKTLKEVYQEEDVVVSLYKKRRIAETSPPAAPAGAI